MAAKRKKTDDGSKASAPTFEQALERLEAIVEELEAGRAGLNESLAHYEEGIRLLKRCYGMLEAAEERIAVLSGFDSEGNPITEPFDDADDKAGSLEAKARARSRRRSHASGKRRSGEDQVDDRGALF